MHKDWTQGLNAAQVQAVEHNEGPLLILAGAGSGKTTVLVARAGRLLDEQKVKADRLCVLTFTNKAAKELKARVGKKLGKVSKKLQASTFHSFGLELIRKHAKDFAISDNFGIIDTSDQVAIVRDLLKNFKHLEKDKFDADRLLTLLSEWREQGRTVAEKDDPYEEALEWLMPHYLKRLKMLSVVDFDMLLQWPIQLAQQNDAFAKKLSGLFDYVMVDEFQDTNRVQMKLLHFLAKDTRNLAVVGDDDQSIYGWRGACVENILEFPKIYDPCKVVALEQNYRSTPQILELANAIIAKNTKRHTKKLYTHHEAGQIPELFVFDDESQESESVVGEVKNLIKEGFSPRQIAILYRSNQQGAYLETEFRKEQMPYSIHGGTSFFDRKETKDVLAYLRCCLFPQDLAFRRILNTPARGIGEKSVEEIEAYQRSQNKTFFQACLLWEEGTQNFKSKAALASLIVQLNELKKGLFETPGSVASFLLNYFETLGYKNELDRISSDEISSSRRWKFVEFLCQIIDKILGVTPFSERKQKLKDFLESMQLREVDSSEEKEEVQLLTLHSSKGLEYDVVFLLGLEDGILPHRMLGQDISEERRLFYVGVTRARKRLFLTRSLERTQRGSKSKAVVSRFLTELPSTLWQEIRGARPVNPNVRKAMLEGLFKKMDELDRQEGKGNKNSLLS